MMRRTQHVGQLPSQTVLKRRRVDAAAAEADVGQPTTVVSPQTEVATSASTTPHANPPTHVKDAPPPHVAAVLESDSDGDDEAELLREQQRLAKLRERNASSTAGASDSTAKGASSVGAYNSDVLFRRASSTKVSAADAAKAKLLRHSNIQASKDHRDFLTHYFR